MKTIFYIRLFILMLSGFLLSSCEEYLETDPPNSLVTGDAVYQSDRLASAAVQGIYHQMFNLENFASGSELSVTVLCGLSADEFNVSPFSTTLQEFYNSEIRVSNSYNLSVWSTAYQVIYMTNAVLEGLENAEEVTLQLGEQLEGEARFARAFTYFYLVNLFGAVPLSTSTDYTLNALLSREATGDVYQMIIDDLDRSRELLDYTFRDGERTHPSYYTATALLARVYLYLEQWDKAEALSSEVIGATAEFNLISELDNVFLANSREAIWQIAPTSVGNTNEGNLFILIDSPVSSFWNPVYLKEELVADFEPGDLRREHWIGTFNNQEGSYYYPYKYKVRLSSGFPTEYSMALRLSEQYLIRSEARLQMGDLPGAQSDLNVIRHRARLVNTMATTAEELSDAIMEERKKEFFAEWGHRWFDLKRIGVSDAVLGPVKLQWQATDVLYPIPEQELERGPHLEQNPGY